LLFTKVIAMSAQETNEVGTRSVNLSEDAAKVLKFLADKQGISENEALERAFATDEYFLKARRAGATVLIQKSNKEIREVIFR
jgi:hypothetical protein